jgi:hypothetical protein
MKSLLITWLFLSFSTQALELSANITLKKACITCVALSILNCCNANSVFLTLLLAAF